MASSVQSQNDDYRDLGAWELEDEYISSKLLHC